MSRDSEITNAVNAARLRLLLQQSPIGFAMGPVACFAVCLGLYGTVSSLRLAVWSGAITLLALTRFVIWSAARRPSELSNSHYWSFLLGSTMTLAAACWGVGGVFLLPGSLSGRLFVFCALMMASVATGSLYSVSPISSQLSIFFMSVPIAVVFTTMEETLSKVVGYGTIVLVSMSIRGLKNVEKMQLRSHELTYDLKESVSLLERSEQMRQELTLLIIHDLRSPLTSLMTRAYLANDHRAQGDLEGTEEHLLRVLRISRSLTDMVNGILDVNQFEDGRFPMTESHHRAEELVVDAMEHLGVPVHRVHIEGDKSLTVYCDGELIKRVLVNLISNALRFQPKDKAVRILVQPVGETLKFQVIDDGPGVSAADQHVIFDKYVSRTEESRLKSGGLGLTFCKLAVEAHGGRIGVQSEPGEGAEFWFSIPNGLTSL